ncbi:MAG: zinc-ribbon domain-containing protein [Thermoplasmata archaeon]
MSLRCSNCGAEMPEGSTVCPECGTLVALVSAEEKDRKLKELAALLEIEEEMPQEVEPKLTEGPSAVHAKKENGRVGLTNGRVNGLSERKGFTNGRREGVKRIPHERKKAVVAFAIILILLASLLLVFFMLPRPSGKINIDGDFSDWSDVQKTQVSSGATVDSIAPTELAMFVDDRTVSFYVKVRDSIFQGSPQTIPERITDGCYILIDGDGKRETGYSALGYGFDYKIGVFGEGRNVRSGSIYAYEEVENRVNWSAWKVLSSIKAASSGSQLELQVGKGTISLSENFTAILIMKSWEGLNSEHFPFSSTGVYIEAEVRAVAPLLLENTPEFLKIDLCAKGGDASLHNISFENLGNAGNYTVFLSDGSSRIGSSIVGSGPEVSIETGNYKLQNGRVITLTLSGDLTGIENGSTAGFRIGCPANIQATAPIVLRHFPGPGNFVGYYREIPDAVAIDGAFGEWREVSTDQTRVTNPNVDIKEQAFALGGMLGMYVGVEGRIFGGEVLPEKTPVVGQGPQPAQPPGYISGEDVLRVYLYTSLSYTNPDYLVEISGLDNELRRAEFYVHSNGGWVKLQSINAKLSYWQLEFEIPNVVKNTFFYAEIEFKDWNSSSVSRVVLSPGVGEEVNVVVLTIMVVIPTWIVWRRREEEYD